MKQSLITILRDKKTGISLFRETTEKIAYYLAQEAMELIPEKNIRVKTPLTSTTGSTITQNIILIPILRSGLALMPVFIKYFSEAKIGFVGLRRDEKTAIAEQYYCKLPKISKNDTVIVLDPMLATGGSASDTLKILQSKGIKQEKIIFVSLIAAPEGIKKINYDFPEIKLIVGFTDKSLNDKKYIVPGLGDFGDRYFGTL